MLVEVPAVAKPGQRIMPGLLLQRRRMGAQLLVFELHLGELGTPPDHLPHLPLHGLEMALVGGKGRTVILGGLECIGQPAQRADKVVGTGPVLGQRHGLLAGSQCVLGRSCAGEELAAGVEIMDLLARADLARQALPLPQVRLGGVGIAEQQLILGTVAERGAQAPAIAAAGRRRDGPVIERQRPKPQLAARLGMTVELGGLGLRDERIGDIGEIERQPVRPHVGAGEFDGTLEQRQGQFVLADIHEGDGLAVEGEGQGLRIAQRLRCRDGCVRVSIALVGQPQFDQQPGEKRRRQRIALCIGETFAQARADEQAIEPVIRVAQLQANPGDLHEAGRLGRTIPGRTGAQQRGPGETQGRGAIAEPAHPPNGGYGIRQRRVMRRHRQFLLQLRHNERKYLKTSPSAG